MLLEDETSERRMLLNAVVKHCLEVHEYLDSSTLNYPLTSNGTVTKEVHTCIAPTSSNSYCKILKKKCTISRDKLNHQPWTPCRCFGPLLHPLQEPIHLHA